MEASERPDPAILVIMGGAGDLTWRMLVPALCDLFADGWLPEKLAIIGSDRKGMKDEAYREHLKDGVKKFCHSAKPSGGSWKEMAGKISFLNMDFGEAKGYRELTKRIEEIEKAWDAEASRIFYLSVPPDWRRPSSTSRGTARASWWRSPSDGTWIPPGP